MTTGTKIQKIDKQNKGGWIKIYRKLFESDFWLSKPFSKAQAWIDLIGLANFHDTSIFIRGIKVDIKRGQLAWSEIKLAERWGWSRKKLRNYLLFLKSVQQISQKKYIPALKSVQQSVQQKINVIQIITIINYNEYQQKDTTECTTEDIIKGTHPKKERKKERRKGKKFIPPSLKEFINYFLDNGYRQDVAERAFKGYEVNNWIDTKGNKVLNWKQKAINVWFKDENKINKQGPGSFTRAETIKFNE